MVQQVAVIVRSFAIDSSFHGINNMLGPRLWRSKLCWLAICCSFFGIFVYFSVLSFDTYIIKKPIQTDLNYHNHEEIQMPEIMFCPVLPNQTAFENFFPGTFGPMFAFLWASNLLGYTRRHSEKYLGRIWEVPSFGERMEQIVHQCKSGSCYGCFFR